MCQYYVVQISLSSRHALGLYYNVCLSEDDFRLDPIPIGRELPCYQYLPLTWALFACRV